MRTQIIGMFIVLAIMTGCMFAVFMTLASMGNTKSEPKEIPCVHTNDTWSCNPYGEHR